MGRDDSRERLIEENKRLIDQISDINKNIQDLRSKSQSRLPKTSHDVMNDDNLCVSMKTFDDAPRDSIKRLKLRLNATEELLGFQFVSYDTQNISGQGLPPGRWVKVTAEILFMDSLLVDIEFVENSQKTSNTVFSSKWTVKNKFQHFELNTWTERNPKDLPGLLRNLKEYASLYQERYDILERFYQKYKNSCNVKNSDGKMLLSWTAHLFVINWLVQWNRITEQFENEISIDINHEDRNFTTISRETLVNLIKPHQTSKKRLDLFMDLGSKALDYCKRQ